MVLVSGFGTEIVFTVPPTVNVPVPALAVTVGVLTTATFWVPTGAPLPTRVPSGLTTATSFSAITPPGGSLPRSHDRRPCPPCRMLPVPRGSWAWWYRSVRSPRIGRPGTCRALGPSASGRWHLRRRCRSRRPWRACSGRIRPRTCGPWCGIRRSSWPRASSWPSVRLALTNRHLLALGIHALTVAVPFGIRLRHDVSAVDGGHGVLQDIAFVKVGQRDVTGLVHAVVGLAHLVDVAAHGPRRTRRVSPVVVPEGALVDGHYFPFFFIAPATFFRLGLAFLAAGDAFRAPAARMAPARSLDTPCFLAMAFCAAANPIPFFALATLSAFLGALESRGRSLLVRDLLHDSPYGYGVKFAAVTPMPGAAMSCARTVSSTT